MTRLSSRRTPLLASLLILVLTLALAQGEPAPTMLDIPVLERYSQAMLALRESAELLADDPEGSAESLERAENAARTLVTETRSDTLRSGLLATFEQAGVALARRSLVDLRVQSAVIRGGLQRILFETALIDAAQGDLAQAQEKAAVLGRDLGFGEAKQEVLRARADSLAQLLATFEQGVGEVIGARLGEVRASVGEREAASLALAEAYAAFIPVQDSLRAREDVTDLFVSAFAALQEGDGEALEQQLDALEVQLAALTGVAEPAAATAAEASEMAEPAEALEPEATLEITVDPTAEGISEEVAAEVSEETNGEVADEVSVAAPAAEPPGDAPDPSAAADDTVSERAEETAQPGPVLATPFGVLPPAGEREASREDAAQEPLPGVALADEFPLLEVTPPLAVRASLRPTPSEASAPGAPGMDRAVLEQRLASPLLSPQETARLADAYEAAGYSGPDALVDSLYSRAARLMVSLASGAGDEASLLLASMRGDIDVLLRPRSAEAAQSADILRGLELAPVLRPQDAALVIQEIGRVANFLADEPVSAAPNPVLAEVNALVGTWWPGTLRMGLVLALALLAFYPLYLLNLAFGGGNRSWRWVALALFLLLLPIIYEGAAYAATLLAQATGVRALAAAATLSPLASPLGDALWTFVTMLAILLASVGLYGICRQFGLRGGGARGARVPARRPARGRAADADKL